MPDASRGSIARGRSLAAIRCASLRGACPHLSHGCFSLLADADGCAHRALDPFGWRSADFSFGTSFSSIRSLTLSVSGVGQCSGQGCSSPTAFDVYLGLRLIHPPTLLPSDAQLGPFSGPFSAAVDLPLPSFLLGGDGRVWLVPAVGSVGSFTSALLTLVPEPSALVLALAAGVLALAHGARRLEPPA